MAMRLSALNPMTVLATISAPNVIASSSPNSCGATWPNEKQCCHHTNHAFEAVEKDR